MANFQPMKNLNQLIDYVINWLFTENDFLVYWANKRYSDYLHFTPTTPSFNGVPLQNVRHIIVHEDDTVCIWPVCQRYVFAVKWHGIATWPSFRSLLEHIVPGEQMCCSSTWNFLLSTSMKLNYITKFFMVSSSVNAFCVTC